VAAEDQRHFRVVAVISVEKGQTPDDVQWPEGCELIDWQSILTSRADQDVALAKES